MTLFHFFKKPNFNVEEVEPTFSKKHGLFFRKGTTDSKMLSECKNNYSNINFSSEDVALDLGSNIGGFAKIALTNGAKKVIAVEADAFNFEVLSENFKNEQRVELLHAAVVGDDSTKVKFVIKDNDNSACAGKVVKNIDKINENKYHVQEVNAVNFEHLLAIHRPSIIKIDIEGAEYLILKKSLPDFVHTVAIELHGMTVETFPKMMFLIEALELDFEIVFDNPTILFGRTNVLLNRIYCRKNKNTEKSFRKFESIIMESDNFDLKRFKKINLKIDSNGNDIVSPKQFREEHKI